MAAALYAPARDEFFTAALGEGAWAARAAARGLRPAGAGRRAHRRTARLAEERTRSRAAARAIQAHVPSLAYRFASVADGRFDAAFASPRAHDWDLAACDLLVHEAGGRLTDLDGAAPSYNREISAPRRARGGQCATLQPELLATAAEVARSAAGGLPV